MSLRPTVWHLIFLFLTSRGFAASRVSLWHNLFIIAFLTYSYTLPPGHSDSECWWMFVKTGLHWQYFDSDTCLGWWRGGRFQQYKISNDRNVKIEILTVDNLIVPCRLYQIWSFFLLPFLCLYQMYHYSQSNWHAYCEYNYKYFVTTKVHHPKGLDLSVS